MLIGRFVGARELGFYNRGYTLMLMPVTQVTAVSAAFSAGLLSHAGRHGSPSIGSATGVAGERGVVLPARTGSRRHGAQLCSRRLWAPVARCDPLVAILAISAAPQIITAMSGLVSQAVGQTRLLSTWGNLSSLSVIIAIAIGLPWGAEGVAIAFAARAYLLLPLSLAPSRLATGIGTAAFVRASAAPFATAAFMGLLVAAIGVLLTPTLGPALCLVVQILVGAGVYLTVLQIVAPGGLAEVIALLRRGDRALSRRCVA